MPLSEHHVQLDLFQPSPLSEETFDYGKGEIKEPAQEEIKASPLCDKLTAFLDRMNHDLQKQNEELQSMIDELQADWTDDEKLQVNNPKELATSTGIKETRTTHYAKLIN